MIAYSVVFVFARNVCICHFIISEKLSDLVLFNFNHFRRISLWSELIWCLIFIVQHFRKSSSQIMSTKFIIKISEVNFNLIKVFELFFISSSNYFMSVSNRLTLLHALTWKFQSRLWALKFFSNSAQFCMSFFQLTFSRAFLYWALFSCHLQSFLIQLS